MSNYLRIVFVMCLLLAGVESFAQQDPQFSQNVNNKLFYNPAYAGMNDGICVYTIGRQQWVGFEGRPETYLLGAHGTFTIPKINLRSGGGLTVVGDALGQMHFTGIKGMYSAHIPLTIIGDDPGYLSIGASVGMLQYGLGNNWRATDPGYTDPRIPDVGFQMTKFDMDAGVFYKTERLFFGVSMSHLNGAEFSGKGQEIKNQFPNDPNVVPWQTQFKMKSHLYVMGGYDFPLSNPMFVVKPSFFLKSDLVTATVDVNALLEWNKFLWGGMSWRYNDAAVVMAGINYEPEIIPGVARFGYAYDITTNKLSSGSNGSHEIFIQYCLKLKEKSPVSKHKSVRFL